MGSANLCDFARLISGRCPNEVCLGGEKESPSGLEEVVARTLSKAERLKFLMFDPDKGNLRLPSGEFEKFQ